MSMHVDPHITNDLAGSESSSPPTGSTVTRIGGLLGVGFIIVMVAASIAKGEVPVWDDPVDTIRAYWEQDGDRYLASKYVISLASVTLFPAFLVALTSALGRGRDDDRPFAQLVMVAGGLHIVVILAADAAWAALASSVDTLSNDAVVMLMALDRGAYQAPGFTLGLFVLATSIAIVRSGRFPRWLGFAGIVPGVAALLSPLSILQDGPDGPFMMLGFVAGLLSMLFILVTAVTLVRSDGAAAEAR